MIRLPIFALLLALLSAGATAQEMENGPAKRAVQLLAASDAFAAFLADYRDWQGEAYPDDEEGGVWHVDFYSPGTDEWLGYGHVNIFDGSIVDSFVPRELTPEEYETGRATVLALALADMEVQTLLRDAATWEIDSWYDRFEATWTIEFRRGIERLAVAMVRDEAGRYRVGDLWDPRGFEAAEQHLLQRDQAIEITFESDSLYPAIAGVDGWYSYAEAVEEGLWLVSVVTRGRLLYYALVDIEAWEIREEGAP